MKIELIAATIVLAPAVFMVACSDDDNDPITSQPPIFSATPVDLSGPYNPADSTFGDIKMVEPVVIPFGAPLDQYRLSPAIEYYTRPEAPVLAVTRGLVEIISSNLPEWNDYEIRVTSLPGSDYQVIYDHVIDLFVLENAVVEPGDTLGRAGSWTDKVSRTELQINYGEGSNERAYCPLAFGDSAFVAAHQKLIDEYNRLDFAPRYDSICVAGTVVP